MKVMAASTFDSDLGRWIELTDGKQFSRLLYTNPVCFLCTVSEATVAPDAEGWEGGQKNDFSKDRDNKTIEGSSQICVPAALPPAIRNVMVLSWLTASNNNGRFMFSICKRRFTSTRLVPRSQFTLCVPVKGMEDLIRSVGSISGRFGSKFSQDYSTAYCSKRGDTVSTTSDGIVGENLSKRQKKKRLKNGLLSSSSSGGGIQGLRGVPIGGRVDSWDYNSAFAIDGTVAHLICNVNSIIEVNNENTELIDADHKLVIGQIERAFVRNRYWDHNKALFRPDLGSLPYLTFFGSQTFGYVVVENATYL